MKDLLLRPILYVNNLITKGHKRSVNTKKNIFASLIIRGLSIVISFFMVPLTLNYLDNTNYGIWLTLTSFIGWFSFFDIGLGNGLRNKFAEALAKGEVSLARMYVSTTYAILTIIIFFVFLLFVVINPFINWTLVFNAPPGMEKELALLVLFIFTFFCIQFVLNLIGVILTADQKPAINGALGFISSLLSLIVIYILTKTTSGSLLLYGLTFSGSTILILLIATIILFKTKYKIYSPSYKFVEFKYARNLLNIGIQFFLIQVSAIILFSTGNVIITQLFGPAEVAPYNISYKYFGMITMGFSIVTTPIWSAYTEAYTKNDFTWILQITRKLKIAWVLLAALSLIMLLISPLFYKYWIGNKVVIPYTLSFMMFIYTITINWGSIFVAFINGVGKIRLQLYTSLIAGVVCIPLSIFFAKTLHLGAVGIVLATTICLSYGPILAPIQYKRIMNKTAKGIWNK